MSGFFSAVWTSVIEYETPRLVKIHNRKVGLVRRIIQLGIVLYVAIYALWLQRGYQEFGNVESSVTTKIKGIVKSELDPDSEDNPALYTRIWDVADYVIPPAENGAFFVATNVIITANQSRGFCPEDNYDVKGVTCRPDPTRCMQQPPSSSNSSSIVPPPKKCRSLNNTCPEDAVIFKAHGPLTGFCIPSDRPQAMEAEEEVFACEVESWCPIEIDRLPLGKRRALMAKAEDYTVFVKNSIAFPYFGPQYVRNNLIGNRGRPCLYNEEDPGSCQIFRLGDMVRMAGGNFSKMAIKGGVVSLSIAWHCNLDYDFMSYCLPHYSFRILDDFGWNFRHGKYHEENRRTLYKMYGIKFIIIVEGRGGMFNLKNTILNVGSGLALLGVTTVVCDFLLMYIKERRMIKQKKYDYVDAKALQQQQEQQQQQQQQRNVLNNVDDQQQAATAAPRRLSEEMMMLQSAISRDLSSHSSMLPRDISVLTTLSTVNGGGAQESNNTHEQRKSYLAEDEDYTDFANT